MVSEEEQLQTFHTKTAITLEVLWYYQVFVALTVHDQSFKKTNVSIYLKLKKEEKNNNKKNSISNTRALSTERGKDLITLLINI